MTLMPTELALDPLVEDIDEYIRSSCFRPGPETHILGDPYRRPVPLEAVDSIDWSRPLADHQLVSDTGLLAHRLLLNIYESAAIFLPPQGLPDRPTSFLDFYASDQVLRKERIRLSTEPLAFGFLDEDASVTGDWTPEALEAHIEVVLDEAARTEPLALKAVESAIDPRVAGAMYIIQMALDGLTEATAMSENLGGWFGPQQSELFKIFIDEFGYGVYDAKHSTLFRAMCTSVGLATDIHHYWHFYLPSSLAVNNYFYYATRNRTLSFRYMGAMAYVEVIFAKAFTDMSKVFRRVFGEGMDARYCDEHAHIDQHHGRMAVHDLVLPLARQHGRWAVRELVHGIEDIRRLISLADQDVIAQLNWQPQPRRASETELAQAQRASWAIDANTPFRTRIVDRPSQVVVLSGETRLHHMATGEPVPVVAGQTVSLPAGRLWGLSAPERALVAMGGAL